VGTVLYVRTRSLYVGAAERGRRRSPHSLTGTAFRKRSLASAVLGLSCTSSPTLLDAFYFPAHPFCALAALTMGIIRPATPGFLARSTCVYCARSRSCLCLQVTLVATILLAVVSFSVPYFKSVFFLKASLEVTGTKGSITFGTLGYCLEIAGQATNCSKPSIGYEINSELLTLFLKLRSLDAAIDLNQLVGDKIKFAQIPAVTVKWLTYALVLHGTGSFGSSPDVC
jgi:hypothetical protein